MRKLSIFFILLFLGIGSVTITHAASLMNCIEKSRTPAEEAACGADKDAVESELKKLIEEVISTIKNENQKNSFIESQAAWEQIRKIDCELLNRRSSGSMHTSDMIYCMTSVARERIRLLKEIKNSEQ